MQQFDFWLEWIEGGLWTYFGIPMVLFLGGYLSIRSRFFQVRHLPTVFRTFFGFMRARKEEHEGVHPLKAFFAAVGGCVGIGNIVAICTAVQFGGPGALFWIWVTAIAGMILKYSEVYLGLRHRVEVPGKGYRGGPMYFLPKAFAAPWLPPLVCLLLCVYGVEVYQFRVIADTITHNFSVSPYAVIPVLLGLVIFAGSGGVKRVGAISSTSLPIFVCLYVGMGGWVCLHHLHEIPRVLYDVFSAAWNGHAAIGGFAGSSMIITISHGVRRGCYTGDVGIGYASVIHSESSEQIPEKQALLAIFDIFLDTFVICTTSLFLILATGVWKEGIEPSLMVQSVLSDYFPYMHIFMPIFLFMLGYTTINAYFCVGLRCAEYLWPAHGKRAYYAYAVLALVIFSFLDTLQAQMIMAIAGVALLLINGSALFRLRDQISFQLPEEATAHGDLTVHGRVAQE